MEVRYEAASPDVSTHEMQIARDKDEIWITVSKSEILPRCASTMGNVLRGEGGVGEGELTSHVHVYVSVLILMIPAAAATLFFTRG